MRFFNNDGNNNITQHNTTTLEILEKIQYNDDGPGSSSALQISFVPRKAGEPNQHDGVKSSPNYLWTGKREMDFAFVPMTPNPNDDDGDGNKHDDTSEFSLGSSQSHSTETQVKGRKRGGIQQKRKKKEGFFTKSAVGKL